MTEVLESALLAELAEFIGYIKSNSSARAVVDAGAVAAVRDESFLASLQVLRSEALDAAAVASSARGFLAGFKALFLCCAEVHRLAARAAAAEDDMDVDVDAATEEDMDVDGRPAPGARASEGSVAPALFPSSGAKRKSAFGGGGGSGEVDTARPHKRRVLKWVRPLQWLPSGTGRVSSASRRSRHARTVARSRIRRPIGKPDAMTVALAKSRIERRIGKPTTTTRRRSQPSLGQHFSRISL